MDSSVAGSEGKKVLEGIRVLDVSTLFAGPFLATVLGDFGADVIKVEHPRGDPARGHGPQKDGVALWWKLLGRNKRTMTLYLGDERGQRIFKRLAATADVVIENFRPGTLEKWGLGWSDLHDLNPRLVLARVTGFGQFGPYSNRPGFGTIAEAMSGFAHITGQAGGPPTLPPFGLADGITALSGAIAVMMALYNRDARGGEGQMIDLAIIEPILSVLGPQPTVYDQLGVIQGRTGNRSVNNSPRNTYRSKDGRWIAVSTSAQTIAERVMTLVGRPDVTQEPWFGSGHERAEHADLLDEIVGSWIAARDSAEVIAAFEAAGAAAIPIYDVSDVMSDPQYRALGSIAEVPDPELGTVKMQNVLFRLSDTPGAIRFAGRPLGADTAEILGSVGVESEELEELRRDGVV
ncbi:MAG TPA: CoA transferase [Trueperaceae bacterium]|nr:CoA transferase [Trueperaceae bacterium]